MLVKKIIHIISFFIFLIVFTGFSTASANTSISFPVLENIIIEDNPLLKSKPKVYPNPFVSEFTLVMEANDNAKVKLQLHNVIGKHIWSGEEMLQAGSNRFTYTFDNIENGIYYLTIIHGDNKKTQKIVKK